MQSVLGALASFFRPVFVQFFLHRTRFTPNTFYTNRFSKEHLHHWHHKPLRQTRFTPNTQFYTEEVFTDLFHQTAFTPDSFYTRQPLLQTTLTLSKFATNSFYTKSSLHQRAFPPNSLYTKHPLHQTPFTSKTWAPHHPSIKTPTTAKTPPTTKTPFRKTHPALQPQPHLTMLGEDQQNDCFQGSKGLEWLGGTFFLNTK